MKPSVLNLIEKAQELPLSSFPTNCIYFLCNGDEVVYIGQAKYLHSRIVQHITSSKTFSKVFYVQCDADKIAEIEQELIACFRPRLNKKIRSDHARYVDKAKHLIEAYTY